VKTAISAPDETFERVERLAQKHRMHRSQFYAKAAERYAAELDAADLTDAIDAVVDVANADSSTRFAVAVSARVLAGSDEEW
jgi:predicted transcriptional regulator